MTPPAAPLDDPARAAHSGGDQAGARALPAALARRLAGGRKQLIARAVGLRRSRALRILDATAGFGGDALLLAALGAEVECCERHPGVLAQLRAAVAELPEDLAARLRVFEGDARQRLREGRWDVVYLDPMYTPSGKRALPRAAAQSLRAMVGADTDSDELLAPARAAVSRRVVVKRALRAPPLTGLAPMQSLRGNSIRFDLYAPDGGAA